MSLDILFGTPQTNHVAVISFPVSEILGTASTLYDGYILRMEH